MQKRITIRDIAREAGVHYSTVSLALRNGPGVSAPVRAKIAALAESMGYCPDPMLSALVAYRKSNLPVHYQATLAWVNNWPRREGLRELECFNEYYLGAEERCAELGYRLEELWLHEPGMTPRKARAVLNARNISGLFLAPQPYTGAELRLDCTDFSAVAFGYSLRPPVFDLVTNHQSQTILLILQELEKLGYRRIGFYIQEDWEERTDNSFLSAFLLYKDRHPDRAVPHCVVPKSNRKSFQAWVAEHRPDSIITIERRAMNWLKDLGLSVPEDIGLVHTSRENHGWAAVYQNDYKIGRTAVDLLVAMMHRGQRGIPDIPTRTLLEGIWCPGPTLRPQATQQCE